MVYININELKVGDILSEDLYNDNGAVLLRNGTKLTTFAIERLKLLGINSLYVEGEIDNDIKVQSLMPNSFKNRIASNLKTISISSTVYNAKNVVSYVLESFKLNNVSLDYMENRTDETYLFQHSIAVAEIAVIIGKALNLEEETLEDLATSALLHDIGKLVSRKDLVKQLEMKLDDKDENFLYKIHPFLGYSYLYNFPEIKATVKNGILFHHINENLQGFPDAIAPQKKKAIYIC